MLLAGSGIGLYAAEYLSTICPRLTSHIVVADQGALDLVTHIANSDLPRLPFLKDSSSHFGGKLCLWGTSAPRPPDSILARFPYSVDDLHRRFSMLESELGVTDVSPYSGRNLESDVCRRLAAAFPDYTVRSAPLAIDKFGRRWSSIGYVPPLARDGARLLSRFRVTGLEAQNRRICAVRGTWLVNDRDYVLCPSVVVLALGVEGMLPLVRQLCAAKLLIEPADHIRIDLHGSLPAGSFRDEPVETLGIAPGTDGRR